ncbi:hypothetical protein CLF_112464 [Clonorchis sinensis]|uniref:Uncharacterized protein n=1 Tax=Clonorchis sinensis TaxID=79923 RepID=G7YWF0_CLOSI|nr:hypothetical protein CLF_112464 [Clonorchis sinensis]
MPIQCVVPVCVNNDDEYPELSDFQENCTSSGVLKTFRNRYNCFNLLQKECDKVFSGLPPHEETLSLTGLSGISPKVWTNSSTGILEESQISDSQTKKQGTAWSRIIKGHKPEPREVSDRGHHSIDQSTRVREARLAIHVVIDRSRHGITEPPMEPTDRTTNRDRRPSSASIPEQTGLSVYQSEFQTKSVRRPDVLRRHGCLAIRKGPFATSTQYQSDFTHVVWSRQCSDNECWKDLLTMRITFNHIFKLRYVGHTYCCKRFCIGVSTGFRRVMTAGNMKTPYCD